MRNEKGIVTLPVIIAIVVVLGAVGILVSLWGGYGDGKGGDKICHSYCLGVIENECGSDAGLGGCFGVWDCQSPTGAHQCLDSKGY